MVSGLERYFQIARCFRDEDLRADRQPEFTQLDIELSFEDQDFILDLMEHMMQRIFKNVLNVDIQIPFKRITWDDAMNLYGSDKPDLRFDMHFMIFRIYFETPVLKYSVMYLITVGL